MRDSKSDQTSTMHQYYFKLLIRQIDPLVNEAWLLLMTNPKSILKDNNYELFDSCSSARLKQCLIKYYSWEICFGEEKGKKISSFTVRPFQFMKSSILPPIIKGK